MSTSENRAATGAHTTNGMPHGATSLTPFLAIPRAADAIEFYRDVFGARLIDATEMGGVVAHADLDFGTGHLQLGEPMPDYHLVASPEGEDDCYSMGIYVPDVDASSSARSRRVQSCASRRPTSCRATALRASGIRSGCGGRS